MDLLRAKLACSPMGGRLFCGGGGGGDGGASERKAAEDSRQQDAIARLNRAFGAGGEVGMPDRSKFAKAGRYESGWTDQPGAPWKVWSDEVFVPESFDDAAYQAEVAQAQQTNAGVGQTRQAREGLYTRFAEDAKALQLDDLQQDRKLAERDVGFDLARRGLYGGSRQIDAGRDIEDQYSRGVLTAENNAQTVADNARTADEKTRVSLINSIRSGMSDADASSAAFAAMQNNANEAANNAKAQSVGGFFDAIRGAANQQQQTAAYEEAFKKYRTGGGSGGSYGGSVRSVT